MGEGRGSQKIGGPLGSRMLKWLTPRSTLLSYVCYHTQFGETVQVQEGESQNILGTLVPHPLGWERDDPLETCFSPPVFPCQFQSLWIELNCLIMEICIPRIPLFKVTRGDWN